MSNRACTRARRLTERPNEFSNAQVTPNFDVVLKDGDEVVFEGDEKFRCVGGAAHGGVESARVLAELWKRPCACYRRA